MQQDSQSNIDHLFRQRLRDVQVPPPSFVWPEVERSLRKRRRRFLFWWFSGLMAVAASLIVGGVARKKNAQKIDNQIVTLSKEKPQEVFENKKSEQVQSNQTTKPITQGTIKKAEIAGRPQNLAAPMGKPESPTLRPILPKPTLASGQDKRGDSAFGPALPLASAAPPLGQEASKEGHNAEKAILLLLETSNVRPVIVSQKSPTTAEVKVSPKATKPSKKAPRNCYDFARYPNAWLFDAYIGPSLAQREFFAPDPENKDYLNSRLNTERSDWAYHAGLRASLMFNRNFLIRTGLHYDQITEVFEFIDPTYVKYLIESTVMSNGQTRIDTVGIEYGENYLKTYNRYGLLDIPLTAGLELRSGRTGLNLNAGASANILFWKRGAILSPQTGEPTYFTPDKNGAAQIYRPRVGLSATASVQWFYHVGTRTRVFVEPYFRRVLRPITRDEQPVEQRYGIGGLRLGFTKILGSQAAKSAKAGSKKPF
jgi:hypothetical protein